MKNHRSWIFSQMFLSGLLKIHRERKESSLVMRLLSIIVRQKGIQAMEILELNMSQIRSK